MKLPEEQTEYRIHAEWTFDCNGKQDYDGPILSISSRMWPPHYDEAEKWTATVRLMIDQHNFPDTFPSGYCLCERDVFADTETETKAQVEAVAKELADKAVGAVLAAFYVDPNGSPK